MREIIQDGKVLARLIEVDDIKDGLTFFSNEKESLQVGSWKYNTGIELKRHIHCEAPRRVIRTHEVIIVQSGRISTTVYDLEEKQVECLEVRAGEILVLLDCGHGYRILEEKTIVIEVKNGPYLGAEIDRRRF